MDLDAIAGIAHRPDGHPKGAIALTHGAGGNRDSPLLIRLCDEWAGRGFLAVRYDLPYRRRRPKGPPSGAQVEQLVGPGRAGLHVDLALHDEHAVLEVGREWQGDVCPRAEA